MQQFLQFHSERVKKVEEGMLALQHSFAGMRNVQHQRNLEFSAAFGHLSQQLARIDGAVCAKDNIDTESFQDQHPIVTYFVVKLRDGGPDCGAAPLGSIHEG